jgi:hypothetical protein
LDSDGTVTRFVREYGPDNSFRDISTQNSSRVQQQDLVDLVFKIQKNNFFGLQDDYPADRSHPHVFTLSICLDGKSKTVKVSQLMENTDPGLDRISEIWICFLKTAHFQNSGSVLALPGFKHPEIVR